VAANIPTRELRFDHIAKLQILATLAVAGVLLFSATRGLRRRSDKARATGFKRLEFLNVIASQSPFDVIITTCRTIYAQSALSIIRLSL